eukprot:2465291-Ditylum_brightwellii.AAC.1
MSTSMEVWNPPGDNESPTCPNTLDELLPDGKWNRWKKKVKVTTKEAFPYLNMQLMWRNNDLSFG